MPRGTLGAGKHAGHGANAAVAAANHDRVDLVLPWRSGSAASAEQLQLGPAAEFELCHDVERLERGGELGAQAVGALMARGARGRVQQGDQFQALGRERLGRCHRAQPLPASSI